MVLKSELNEVQKKEGIVKLNYTEPTFNEELNNKLNSHINSQCKKYAICDVGAIVISKD